MRLADGNTSVPLLDILSSSYSLFGVETKLGCLGRLLFIQISISSRV